MLQPSPAAELVEAFTNTVDLESGDDDVATTDALARWLTGRRLAEPSLRLTADDHRGFLDLRAGIREALDTDDPVAPHRLAVADAALSQVPLLVRLSDPRAPLVPAPGGPPARTALARLAAAWAEVVFTGEVHRLKRCAEHTCGWVFWDSSKNHSRRWCSMRVCGNRTKSRRYAARQRDLTV
ncbi:CGNR zinc finger domain-containing protein [Streptomyces sp. 11x1]|uniref:CGNR zinc finger domain-containing protein n=1 Tax=Streptomyces sp. 11x1 TaxID=3038642 RepID=UPI002930E55C|nr:CGNR zinc finger domain-containing protein [Streptomyces sp. 11x1]WNZ06266.1 CGNR zinc finger domain-containing protein [Streptomyces sp. 11x1]